MSLLINYGTNASAGGQSVIAEIQIETQATNTELTLTFLDNTFGQGTNNDYAIAYAFIPNGVTSLTVNDLSYFNNITIHENASVSDIGTLNNVIFSTAQNKPTSITFDFPDGNNRIIRFLIYKIAFTPVHPGSPTSFATLQLLTVSYNTPAPATTTTTFYDSYPGGNVIGTTNGTEVAGSVSPGYLQIDPPTGKKIKQIVLKGL